MDPITPQLQEQQYQAPMMEMPSAPKHFGPKTLAIIGGILLVAGGAYAGVWYWQNQQVAQEAVPTFTPRADEMAGWQTYTSAKYGFTVKVPASFIQSENKPAGIPQISFNLNSKTVFSVAVFNSRDTVTESYGWDWKAAGTSMVGGYQATKLQRTTGQYVEIAYLIIAKNVSINFEDSGFSATNQQILDQILSTFKFTDSLPINASLSPTPSIELTTFKDSRGRFEIKYPSEGINLDYSNQYPSGDYRVFGVNNVGVNSPIFYLSLYAKPLQNPLDEIALCREAGGFYIRQYHTDEKIIVGGTSHVKCLYDRELEKDQVLVVSFNASGYTWQFIATYYDTYHIIIDQILSTFKFTK